MLFTSTIMLTTPAISSALAGLEAAGENRVVKHVDERLCCGYRLGLH